MNHRLCALAFGILCSSLIATPVFAQTAATPANVPAQINAANQLVRDGDIQAAIEAYSTIEGDPSSQPQLDFNRGVALYRNGDIAAAQKLFMEAAGTADARLAANANYNLGNCLYSQSLQQIQQPDSKAEPARIIEQLRKAIAHYRSSLRTGDSGADARANIELAAELIRQLEQQEQEQQEQEQQDQQNQDQQSEDQNQEQDQQGDDQSTQDQSQSENDSEQQQQNGEQSEQEQQQQQSGQQQNDQNQNKPTQEEQQGKSGQPDSAGNTDSNDPENAGITGQEENGEEEQQPTNPEGELKAAGDQQQDGKPANAAAQRDDTGRPMTREEAMKMLQAIRDRDMIRRLRQQGNERSRQIPVEKDW